MIEYVNKAHCNSQNDYGIPFAHIYNMFNPFAKFKSLNSEDSPDLDDILKKHIHTGGIMGALTGMASDALIL